MKNLKYFSVLILSAGILFYSSPTTFAHTRTISYSQWETDAGDSWRIKAQVPVAEFMRIYGAVNWNTEDAAAYIYRHLAVHSNSFPSFGIPIPISSEQHGIDFIFRWEVQCNIQGTIMPVIEIDPFFEHSPSHLHVAEFIINNVKHEKIITPGNTIIYTDRLAKGQENWSAVTKVLGFSSAGIHHLLAGLDHMFFILALCLLVSNLSALIKIVTAFTLAHALALTPVLLGWIDTASRSVGALIGLSIAVVAIEAMIRLQPEGLLKATYTRKIRQITASVIFFASLLAAFQIISIEPLSLLGFGTIIFCTGFLAEDETLVSWIHAFGFGLVHGLGIAGALSKNLLGSDIAFAVAGFNIGIEAGQLLVAIVILATLTSIVKLLEPLDENIKWSCRERIKLSELPLYGICTCLIMIGTYWFSMRSISFWGI